jgi:long-subunit acyl-CoA synthetase (AMP-forming)
VRSLYREEIDRLLAAAADHEQVGEFVLIDRPFSIEHGEATPKLSLCRDAVAERFRQEIEAMYRRTGARAPRSSADGASA